MGSPEQQLVTALASRHQTVATAESCTGGLVSQRVTAVAGASAVFACGVCAYSADIKQRLLEVPQGVIEAFGTVSRDTALHMARGVRALAGAEMGVSVTGCAGPSPCEGKPIGTVFIACATPTCETVRSLMLEGDREAIREAAATAVLELALEVLQEDPLRRDVGTGE